MKHYRQTIIERDIMKINDFIFEFDANQKYQGLCRVRCFVNSKLELYAVITDLGEKNPAASITNAIEQIYEKLTTEGYINKKYRVIEHYEDTTFGFGLKKYGMFHFINIGGIWESCEVKELFNLLEVGKDEFLKKTWKNRKLIEIIENKRMHMNALFDYPDCEDPKVVSRRLKIEETKIKKAELEQLIQKGAAEREFLNLLKKDLSVFGEIYASPAEEYICFSEFPIGDGGRVDFAVFSSRSRMEITLVEVKGADFNLVVNNGGYEVLAKKMEVGIAQIKQRSGYVHRNYEAFRKQMHSIRIQVENGKQMYNSLLGPKGKVLVDPNKDVNIRYVVIGGRTNEDLKESWTRQNYQSNNPPFFIETWDTFLRRVVRD